jgi:biopolymer transport protein ExbD
MAASSSSNDADEGISGINVTPLVDITLVLLIIFMVTAKLIVQQAIPMDLPKAASAGEQQTVFAVTIDEQGHVLADGKPMTDDVQLQHAAKDALDHTKDLRTVIQASTAVNHGTVIHVLDELRQVGVTKVAFATAPNGKTTTEVH